MSIYGEIKDIEKTIKPLNDKIEHSKKYGLTEWDVEFYKNKRIALIDELRALRIELRYPSQ